MDVGRRYLLLVSYPSDSRGRLEVTKDTLTVNSIDRIEVPTGTLLNIGKFEVS